MTDYQTKQKHRNIIVGSFVLVATVAFVWMLWKFREFPLLVSKYKSFEVRVFYQEIPGVQPDTPVQYCGYQVGRVMEITRPEIHEGAHRVGVTIAIDNYYDQIPSDSEFVIMKRGLGSSYIVIRDVSEGQPSGYLSEGMVLNGSVTTASDFFPPEVQAALPNLVETVSNLAENVNAVIGDRENQANIKKTLSNAEAAVVQLEKTLESIEQLSNEGTAKIVELGDKIVEASEALERTLSETRRILAKMESGDGTAGKLINDGRLYENLIESSEELKILLRQLKEWAADSEKGLKVDL
jgi:phospholipid/cholesterol/gamma-HCH transport system substrate-binding protein